MDFLNDYEISSSGLVLNQKYVNSIAPVKACKSKDDALETLHELLTSIRKAIQIGSVACLVFLSFALNAQEATQSPSPTPDTTTVNVGIDTGESTLNTSDIPSIRDLSNTELVDKLNDISEMSSKEQRELLIEIQRRILKEGPEPFIQRRKEAIASSTSDGQESAQLNEDLKIVTTEIHLVDTREVVRDPEKANVKRNKGKKPIPYGSTYSE